MFQKVLIANRGEIACRIASTLHELGIRSVAVYSEADRGALHTRLTDEAWPIGPAEPRASYLNIEALLEAAKKSGAQAVHPGYGFLAENATFAEAVERAGLTFIGPTADQIRAMGDKRAARTLAEKAKVPVVPGAEGDDPKSLTKAAAAIGYPVMVKAALGGGGKGMRAVHDAADLAEALDSARRVATSAFGDGTVYLEKQIERPRHVEVQVLGDGNGNAVHLFERECSLQRRHQKVIEESPSPAVDDTLRERLTFAAVALAQAVKYRGAGTIEFLVDGRNFYFLEMNTRLQVEHPVTELVTGFDLVRAQIVVAAEGRLPWTQHEVRLNGHAIEARVYAEDPARGFLPQSGTLARLRWPHGAFLRVDRGEDHRARTRPRARAHPADRRARRHARPRRGHEPAVPARAGARSRRAERRVRHRMDRARVPGRLRSDRAGAGARAGGGRRRARRTARPRDSRTAGRQRQRRRRCAGRRSVHHARGVASAGARLMRARYRDGSRSRAVEVTPEGGGAYRVTIDDASLTLSAEALDDGRMRITGPDGVTVVEVTAVGSQRFVRLGAMDFVLEREAGGRKRDGAGSAGTLEAPMPGVVTRVLVKAGDAVEKGQPLIAIEAMKMEHVIRAPRAGRVAKVAAAQGEMVKGGVALVEMEDA